jgi:hypothetical protein
MIIHYNPFLIGFPGHCRGACNAPQLHRTASAHPGDGGDSGGGGHPRAPGGLVAGVPEKVPGGFGSEPGQVQQGSGEGSGEVLKRRSQRRLWES